MSQVKVVSVEDAGYYIGEGFSGSTLRVVLQRDNEFVECDGVALWNEDPGAADSQLFNEWSRAALNKETGYRYWKE